MSDFELSKITCELTCFIVDHQKKGLSAYESIQILSEVIRTISINLITVERNKNGGTFQITTIRDGTDPRQVM